MSNQNPPCPICGAGDIRSPAGAISHVRQEHPDKAKDWVVNFPSD